MEIREIKKVKFDTITSDKVLVLIEGIDDFLISGIRFREGKSFDLLIKASIAPSAIQQAEECSKCLQKEMILEFIDCVGTIISKVHYSGLEYKSWDFDTDINVNSKTEIQICISFDYTTRKVQF